jgi:hypothetical protein
MKNGNDGKPWTELDVRALRQHLELERPLRKPPTICNGLVQSMMSDAKPKSWD